MRQRSPPARRCRSCRAEPIYGSVPVRRAYSPYLAKGELVCAQQTQAHREDEDHSGSDRQLCLQLKAQSERPSGLIPRRLTPRLWSHERKSDAVLDRSRCASRRGALVSEVTLCFSAARVYQLASQQARLPSKIESDQADLCGTILMVQKFADLRSSLGNNGL